MSFLFVIHRTLLEKSVSHTVRKSAVLALSCAVAGALLVGCEDSSASEDKSESSPSAASGEQSGDGLVSGTKKIKIDGQSINVSCTGKAAEGRPVIVLMAGAGDGLEKLAGIQKTLSKKDRVCSYDRPGEGKSDKPKGPQDFASSHKLLSAVLEKTAGDSPVVLAGHSLGGLIAARYTPDHEDKVKGLVLLDATPPNAVKETQKAVPADYKGGPAADVRAQMVQMGKGQNPEMIKIEDGPVHSAGDIPVEVVKHGPDFLTQMPEYGQELEKVWSDGQKEWLKLSSESKLTVAEKSTHYVYVDQPEVAVKAIQDVTSKAAG